MKRKATKIVELVIADDSEELTIDAISLVTSPAIEQDFVFFGKENNNLTLAKVDEEKRMLVSPALIPNKQIFRYDPNTDSNYYVYFSKETVRQASELYLKHNNHHKATYQHEDRVSGVLTIESWIKEGEQDKSKLYGFDLPDGTWFVKMKIENDEMWNKIKDGELKGLSIEGYFINKMEKMGKQQFSNEEIREAIKELLSVQKIELGAIDDYKKAIGSAIKKVDKFTSDYKKFIDTKNKEYQNVQEVFADKAKKEREKLINTLKNKLGNIEEDTFDMFEKIYDDAQELGVLDVVQKELNSISKKLDNKVDEFNDIKREYTFDKF